ncbi:hypothetical protein FQZ97_1243070 [compost metagenome]
MPPRSCAIFHMSSTGESEPMDSRLPTKGFFAGWGIGWSEFFPAMCAFLCLDRDPRRMSGMRIRSIPMAQGVGRTGFPLGGGRGVHTACVIAVHGAPGRAPESAQGRTILQSVPCASSFPV